MPKTKVETFLTSDHIVIVKVDKSELLLGTGLYPIGECPEAENVPLEPFPGHLI